MRNLRAPVSMASVKWTFRQPLALAPVPLLTLVVFWAGQHLWVVAGVVLVQAGWLVMGLRAPQPEAPLRPG